MSILELASRVRTVARLDFAPTHRQPSTARLVVASALAVSGSILADALLAKAGIVFFPSTTGYEHFQFADYAKLTIIGVLIACVAWPVTTRITSAPRWLFSRLAVLVSLVLYVPDLWLLVQGQPSKAVFVLVLMHFAIAVVTYNSLVRIARPLTTNESEWSAPRRRSRLSTLDQYVVQKP